MGHLGRFKISFRYILAQFEANLTLFVANADIPLEKLLVTLAKKSCRWSLCCLCKQNSGWRRSHGAVGQMWAKCDQNLSKLDHLLIVFKISCQYIATSMIQNVQITNVCKMYQICSIWGQCVPLCAHIMHTCRGDVLLWREGINTTRFQTSPVPLYIMYLTVEKLTWLKCSLCNQN